MTTTVKMLLAEKGGALFTVQASDSLHQVCDVLSKNRIGAVLILGEGGQLRGILSERDIVKMLAQFGAEALTHKASTAMTSKVETCTEVDSLDSLMTRMTAGRFRHFPVVAQDRVVGLISIGDVMKSWTQELEREVHSMREYISQ